MVLVEHLKQDHRKQLATVSVASSVDTLQILRLCRSGYTELKSKLLSQCHTGFILDKEQHPLGYSLPIGKPLIAMIAEICIKHMIWLNCIPNLNIGHRLQPFDHIFNIFKNHYEMSVSNLISPTQIEGAIS